MIYANLTLISVLAKRVIFYNEPIEGKIVTYIIMVLWQSANMICIHLVITKVGMIYIDTEVLREGNDMTLNNLDDGVFILNEPEMHIQFMNTAAMNFGETETREKSA